MATRGFSSKYSLSRASVLMSNSGDRLRWSSNALSACHAGITWLFETIARCIGSGTESRSVKALRLHK